MIKDSVTPEDVVKVLNFALEIDSNAINQLVSIRVICNEKMAKTPDIQVGVRPEGGYRVGILGILNGVFGKDEKTSFGCICANIDCKTGLVDKFSVLNNKDFERIADEKK